MGARRRGRLKGRSRQVPRLLRRKGKKVLELQAALRKRQPEKLRKKGKVALAATAAVRGRKGASLLKACQELKSIMVYVCTLLNYLEPRIYYFNHISYC